MGDEVGRIGQPALGLPGTLPAAPGARPAPGANCPAFGEVLREASAGEAARVRFSAHAQQRLAQASVQLDPRALATLEAAVDKAERKGGKESLVLLDDLAFVVSVKNRTVITAVDADRMADSVFTNIDSVVIARHHEPDPQGELSSAE